MNRTKLMVLTTLLIFSFPAKSRFPDRYLFFVDRKVLLEIFLFIAESKLSGDGPLALIQSFVFSFSGTVVFSC